MRPTRCRALDLLGMLAAMVTALAGQDHAAREAHEQHCHGEHAECHAGSLFTAAWHGVGQPALVPAHAPSEYGLTVEGPTIPTAATVEVEAPRLKVPHTSLRICLERAVPCPLRARRPALTQPSEGRNERMRTRTAVAALLGQILLLLVLTAACGDDDGAGGSANASAALAAAAIDGAGLHDLEETLTARKPPDADARTRLRHLETTVRLTGWPDGLDDEAAELADSLAALAAAVDSAATDYARAAPLATAAHDLAHDFTHEVWAALAKEAGLSAGVTTEGDDH